MEYVNPMAPQENRLLDELNLPSRYEALVRTVGPEVLRILVKPAAETMETLQEAAEAVKSLGEGLFLPIHADSGTGKTTLAENLTVFAPDTFAKTLSYSGEVDAREISEKLATHYRDELAANDSRVVPINMDHREGAPPSETELAQIKRFLRQDSGSRALLIWPETSGGVAQRMSDDYRRIAGVLPLAIPVKVAGPSKETWRGLAGQTLEIANSVESLEHLIDIDQYDPSEFVSLGDFLKRIATDFNARRLELIRDTVRDVRLTIVWVSESTGHGILSSISSSRRYGMLDPGALIQACSDSSVGKWWDAHRGLLVQSILALDAHVVSVAPPLALATMSRYGTEEYKEALRDLKFASRPRSSVATYLERSDLGRRLRGEARSVGEGRGNPAQGAKKAFGKVAESIGFQGARDKALNRAFAESIRVSFPEEESPVVSVESSLGFLPDLIPDVSIDDSRTVHCLEFTYRKSDFLVSANRSTIAQYCLTKLKNYAHSMGWVSPGK